MASLDISEPGVDVEKLFCQFAYNHLQPFEWVQSWRHVDVWRWSIGPIIEGYPGNIQDEEDRRMISILMEVNMDSDIIALVDTWIHLGWVFRTKFGTFDLTDDGIRMLKESGGI